MWFLRCEGPTFSARSFQFAKGEAKGRKSVPSTPKGQTAASLRSRVLQGGRQRPDDPRLPRASAAAPNLPDCPVQRTRSLLQNLRRPRGAGAPARSRLHALALSNSAPHPPVDPRIGPQFSRGSPPVASAWTALQNGVRWHRPPQAYP